MAGRPRKSSEERRSREIKITVTDAELAALKRRAKQAGMPLARFLRETGSKAQVVNRTDWRRAVYELNRIGNNLNQVARWCNTYKGAAEAAGVVAALMQIDRGIRDLALPSRDASEGDAS